MYPTLMEAVVKIWYPVQGICDGCHTNKTNSTLDKTKRPCVVAHNQAALTAQTKPRHSIITLQTRRRILHAYTEAYHCCKSGSPAPVM